MMIGIFCLGAKSAVERINAQLKIEHRMNELERQMDNERKLLGCQTTGQCFCTGRCKRTAEEQAAHEAQKLQMDRLSKACGYQDAEHAEKCMKNPYIDPNVIGRQTFEPKPGHGEMPYNDPRAEATHIIRMMEKERQCDSADIPAPAPSALDTQIGGDHYKTMGEFQPWSVLQAWLTPEEFRGYMKGTAIAYLARERQKGGDQDVSKATHTLQGLIEMLGAK